MKFIKILITTILLLQSPIIYSQIISEILPAPVNNAPEWIEIYNNTSSFINDIIILKDATAAINQIPIELNSNKYCVITKDTSAFKLYYKIPDSAILIQSKIPILNNTDDYLYLFNSKNELIDSLYYFQKKSDYGFSIERISQDVKFQNSNFAVCVSKDSNTAGFINSVDINNGYNTLKINYDESYDHLTFDIINNSNLLYNNIDFKIIFNENEITKEIIKIDVKDTIFLNIQKSEISDSLNYYGLISIELLLVSEIDTIFQTLYNINLNIPQNSLFLNEILFDSDNLHSEFIELYNNTENHINLQNLNIVITNDDKISTYQLNMRNIVNPKDYFLITGDSVIFNNISRNDSHKVHILNKSYFLNNNGDSVLITDNYYNILDSLYYSADFHNNKLLSTKNRSLERKSYTLPANFENNLISCLDENYSTPLRINYCSNMTNDKTIIKISNYSFNKEKDSDCTLSIQTENFISYCQIKILDINGNFIKSIGNIDNIGNNYQIDIAPHLFSLLDNAYIIQVSITDAISNQFSNYNLMIAVGK